MHIMHFHLFCWLLLFFLFWLFRGEKMSDEFPNQATVRVALWLGRRPGPPRSGGWRPKNWSFYSPKNMKKLILTRVWAYFFYNTTISCFRFLGGSCIADTGRQDHRMTPKSETPGDRFLVQRGQRGDTPKTETSLGVTWSQSGHCSDQFLITAISASGSWPPHVSGSELRLWAKRF